MKKGQLVLKWAETIEETSLRSLYWLPGGAHYPDCAMLSPEVDEEKIRTSL